MTKKVYVDISATEIADYICQKISEDDFRILIECCGADENYNPFFELWTHTEWEFIYPSGEKFLKRLREELNKMELD